MGKNNRMLMLLRITYKCVEKVQMCVVFMEGH